MKYLFLLFLLAGCDPKFDEEGVLPQHITKAAELCENNGGLKRIWYASKSVHRPTLYRMSLYCDNGAEFNENWEAK